MAVTIAPVEFRWAFPTDGSPAHAFPVDMPTQSICHGIAPLSTAEGTFCATCLPMVMATAMHALDVALDELESAS